MIGLKFAFLLYGLLVLISVATLHGTPLALALVIVLGLAAKTMVDHVRRRRDG
jgi:hypothetical protein